MVYDTLTTLPNHAVKNLTPNYTVLVYWQTYVKYPILLFIYKWVCDLFLQVDAGQDYYDYFKLTYTKHFVYKTMYKWSKDCHSSVES